MRKSKLNKLEKEIRDMLKKEDIMTIDEINDEVERLMVKYNMPIAMIGTEERELNAIAVYDKKGKMVIGCLAKLGREEVKQMYIEEINEKIEIFNRQDNIQQDNIITLIETLSNEYPIEDILFKIEDNNKVSIANLELAY